MTTLSPGPPTPRRVLVAPARALALPLAFTILLLALSFWPAVYANPHLRWSFWGAAAALLLWNVLLLAIKGRGRSTLTLEIVIRKQHWMQACSHMSILLYWGWYWRTVYDSAPLILAQLLFAFALDALLSWSRRDVYTFGFGPFPIIFSTNLFLWFKPDWFYLQFVMVAVGFAGKELIRWNKDGRPTHIFNPSSFTLSIASLLLLMTGMTSITWGPEIASTQFYPPHIYLLIFAVTLPAQFLFGTAAMTLPAVATTYTFCLVYFAATGTHYFPEQPIPIAVFLGMHLLFTDPSTAPRTDLGRIIFGVLYGLSVVGIAALLTALKVPNFYDKLLPVPILNLLIQGIDRAVRSNALKRFDPGALGRRLVPSQRNVAYMVLWAITFATMTVLTGTQATLVRADSLLDQGRIEEAIARYREFVGTDPTDPEGHNNLGAALMKAGRDEDAVASFQRSIQLRADNPKTLNNLGVALMRTGRFEAAVAPLQRAVELQPDNPDARGSLGQALMQVGRLEEAVASFQRAVALRPNSPEAHDNLGVALMQAGRLQEATASLERAVVLGPQNAEARRNFDVVLIRSGEALMQAGRFDEAGALFQRTIDMDPASAVARYDLGVAQMQAGRSEEARASLQRAVELNPDDADTRYNLAHVLTALGQPDAAIVQLREALRIRPDWPAAAEALAGLERARAPGRP